MLRFLSESIVIAIHDDQIRLYGGHYGLHNVAALDAAIHMPQAQFDGKVLNFHPTVFHMAAAYGFHLCQNHPFLDGNKRVAGMAMLTFLKLNGLEVVATEIDYYHIMMSVANGACDKEQIASWLRTVTIGTPPEIT